MKTKFHKGQKVKVCLDGHWYEAKVYSYNPIKKECEVILRIGGCFNIEESLIK